MRYAVLAVTAGCAMTPTGSRPVAAIDTCPAGTWCIEAAPTTGTPLLHGVWAVSADDVFAVGDTGTILRRTNDAWTAMTSGTTDNLRGVWASSSTDVWAGGATGTIVHFDGTAWTAVANSSTDVDAVWGSSPTDVWFAGSSTVLHWNGAAFTSTAFGGTLLSVSGTGPGDVWVTGEDTNLHHFTGSSWTTVNPGAGTATLFAVLPISTTEVWASDINPGKETVHLTGGKWVAQKTGGAIFDGMSALSSTDLWAAGGDHTGHWNGSAWTIEQPFGTSASLWSVTTTASDAWVVGDSALIAHRPL